MTKTWQQRAAALCLTGLLASTAAVGAPADVPAVMNDDGLVVGSVWVPVGADRMREVLADPMWVSGIDDSGTTVTVRTKDGACDVIDYSAPSAFGSVDYTAKRCPTSDGFRVDRMESKSLKVYNSRWRVSPVDSGGSVIRYELSLRPSFPVPRVMIKGTLTRSVDDLLGAVKGWAGAQ